MICRCSSPKQKPADKATLKLLGLSKDWEIMYKTHDEIIARYKPTGITWGFRY